MTFEIELSGTRRAVSVEPAGDGRYRVRIAGGSHDAPHVVKVERAGEFGLSLIVDGDAGISRDVTVAPGTAKGELFVGLGGRTVLVHIDGRRRRASTDGAAHADGEQSVVAPMPGRVVRVLVGVGDEVAARQGVVVVEAMKMENELRSPKAGKIKDVTVAPGALVEAGRVLVVIE